MFMPSLEERKGYIAKIATKVFLAKGYATATLQDVSEKTGMSKAGLYHYFNTKEEILYHIIITTGREFVESLRDYLRECEAEGLEPEDILRKYLTKYAYDLNRSRDIPLLILRERHQLTGKYKTELYKFEQEVFEQIKNQLKKVPQIDKKYDLNLVSFKIISAAHWLGYWLKQKGRLDLESAVKQNIDIIFHGIMKK